MNKKITTLLASAMLATAFSAGAVKVGDQVLLKGGSAYLSVATQTVRPSWDCLYSLFLG